MDTADAATENNDSIEKRELKLQAARDRHNFLYQNDPAFREKQLASNKRYADKRRAALLEIREAKIAAGEMEAPKRGRPRKEISPGVND